MGMKFTESGKSQVTLRLAYSRQSECLERIREVAAAQVAKPVSVYLGSAIISDFDAPLDMNGNNSM